MPLCRTRVTTKSLYQDATPHRKHDILALNWSNPEKQNYRLLKMVVYFLSARGMIKRVIHLFLLNLSVIPPHFFFNSENNSDLHCHSEIEPKFSLRFLKVSNPIYNLLLWVISVLEGPIQKQIYNSKMHEKTCPWEGPVAICKLMKFCASENQKYVWPHGSEPTEVSQTFPSNLNGSSHCNF